MSVFVGLVMMACSDDPAFDNIPGGESDMVDVTFTLTSETNMATRANSVAGGGPGQWQATIGKGEKIDMLVYAIYDDTYTLLTQYGQGNIAVAGASPFNSLTPALSDSDNSLHKGQTIVNVGPTLANGGSYKITVRLMRNKVYHMAFWAQSSKTTAYNTNDLEEVTVSYDGLSNDELRDAFCKVETFSVSADTDLEVVLTRPFAQINVGVTGPAYNNQPVKYSTMSLSGVANEIDVVRNIISGNEKVVFGWNKLASYVNTDIPDNPTSPVQNEEFLLADLDFDGSIKGYQTGFPSNTNIIWTETFKYLSMNYVLVSSSSSTVLSEVKIALSDNKNGKDDYDLTLQNVPVRQNWRTNILSGFQRNSTIFNSSDLQIDQDPI